MGTTVLDSGVPLQQGLHVYAHCLATLPGGVALLIVQNDREASHSLELPSGGQRYTLAAARLDGPDVMLNGTQLSLGPDDRLPDLKPVADRGGVEHFAPTTITFITYPAAHDSACQ